MAFPIETYIDIYDDTYHSGDPKNRGSFGHLVIRDSNTVAKDYLLVGCNYDETDNLTVSIRLNEKQVRKVIQGLREFLYRIKPANRADKKRGGK